MQPGIIILIIFVVLLSALLVVNTRITRRLVAQGLCPMCAGAGREFVQMNGLEGCFECTDGTLTSYRTTMHSQGRKAWA